MIFRINGFNPDFAMNFVAMIPNVPGLTLTLNTETEPCDKWNGPASEIMPEIKLGDSLCTIEKDVYQSPFKYL